MKKLHLFIAVSVSILFLFGTHSHAITVSVDINATSLANNIAGSGIRIVGTPTLTGAKGQAGTYTGAAGPANGVVFSSGLVTDIPGTPSDTLTTDLSGPGDPDISALPGRDYAGVGISKDAVVLEFDFTISGIGAEISFFFATDDTPFDDNPDGPGIGDQDIFNHSYNDGAYIGIDGIKIAFLPNGDNLTSLGMYDYYSTFPGRLNPRGNSAIRDLGFNEYVDGFSAIALGTGVHHMKIAIADGGNDGLYDSGLFIPNGSLSAIAPVPLPPAVWLFGSGLIGLVGVARQKT